ncbi:hypothetical protein BGM09_00795 [Streptomyces sp. CBMA29]|nr:hypothetical protein [Streptomyces sp. CBMA29]
MRIVELDEAQIDKAATEDFWFFDIAPCGLEGDDLGVHEWLKVEVTDTGDNATYKVIDCDRKNEK